MAPIIRGVTNWPCGAGPPSPRIWKRAISRMTAAILFFKISVRPRYDLVLRARILWFGRKLWNDMAKTTFCNVFLLFTFYSNKYYDEKKLNIAYPCAYNAMDSLWYTHK